MSRDKSESVPSLTAAKNQIEPLRFHSVCKCKKPEQTKM